MDRTSWIAVVVCIILLVAYYPAVQYFYPPPQVSERSAGNPTSSQATASGNNASFSESSLNHASNGSIKKSGPFFLPGEVLIKSPALGEERRVVLENNWVEVSLSTHGGAIKQIKLKKHEVDEGQPVVLHKGLEEPILNLIGWDGSVQLIEYGLERYDSRSVLFSRVLPNGLKLLREYTLSGDYQITYTHTLENTGPELKAVDPYQMLIGLGEGIYSQPQERPYLGGGWYTEKEDFHSYKIQTFDDGAFLFIFPTKGRAFVSSEAGTPIRWAAASSQFFTVVFVCRNTLGSRVDLRKVPLPELAVKSRYLPEAVETRLEMPGFTVPAGGKVTQEFNLYAGPKEDSRLSSLAHHEEKIMEFGWLGFIARPLLATMKWIHSYVNNYGVSIILMTVLIKILLWYPQARANRSMKKMQVLSPKLRELQAKYKDEPARLQQEMVKLYREYDVNPVGGCLPLLAQLPIFIGFYYMLNSAIELRHASFLWIGDLSKPDTLAHLPLGAWQLPLNPMPLLMTASMFWSMRITPQPEGVDNPSQKIMKFMPILMLFFCYNLSAALSLYWTVQNLLSIGQTYYNLKQPLPVLKKKVLSSKG